MTSHQVTKISSPPSLSISVRLASASSGSDQSEDMTASSEEGKTQISSDHESALNKPVSQDKEPKHLRAEEKRPKKCKTDVKVLGPEGSAYKETKQENKHLLRTQNGNSNLDVNDIGINEIKNEAAMTSNNNPNKGRNSNGNDDDDSDYTSNGDESKQKRRHQLSRDTGQRPEGNETDKDTSTADEVLKHSEENEGSRNYNGDLQEEVYRETESNGDCGGINMRDKITISDMNMKSYECVALREDDVVQGSGGSIKDTEYEKLCINIGVDTKDLGWDKHNEQIKKQNVTLKHELQKIVKVNNDWDTFWTKKKTHFEQMLAEKDAVIAKLRQCEAEGNKLINAEVAEKERYQNEKDEMLLLSKERIAKLESVIEQLRTELSQARQKGERAQKFSRTLLQKNKELELEIKRLNAILETKVKEHKSLKLLNLSSGLSSFSVDPQRNDASSATKSVSHYKERERRVQPQNKKEKETHKHQHLPQEYEGDNDDSLTKEELKERLMLLKEQKNVYESDFRKERRDRENLVGQLEDAKQKLDHTKERLKERRHDMNHLVPHGVSPGHRTTHHRKAPRNRYEEPICLCPN